MADRNDLLDILGAQVAEVLRTGDDERTMVGALALIEFLRRDPRLSGIVGELLGEAEAEKRRFREHCRKVVAEVRGLWQRHREAFERSRAEAGEALDFGIHGGFEGFERRLVDPSDDILPAHIEPSDDNSQAHQGLDDLSYWCRNLIQFLEHKKRDPGRAIKALDRRLRALTERQEEMFQRFWVAARALAGFALQRLSYFAEWLIPPSGDEPTDGTQWLLAYRVRLTRKALFDPTVRKSEKGQREFQASAVRLRRDVELLCRGVREKIIVGDPELR